MLITIGSVKGGVGKSIIATNLTYLRSLKGTTLLVDCDEQRNALDWTEQRIAQGIDTPWVAISLTGKYVYAQIQKMVKDYRNIIFDCSAKDTTTQRSCLTISDIFLIPFRPKSFDVWTVKLVKQMVDEVRIVNPKIKPYIVLNQCDSRGQDNQDALSILQESCPDIECLPIFIGYRKAFSNAAAEGRSVVELDPEDKKASKEIKELYNVIFN